MKRLLLVIAGMIAGCAIARYGTIPVSYLLIPPDYGYFRYYENYDMDRSEPYWVYWHPSGSFLQWSSLREGMSGEDWELVPDTGHRYFLYDARNEFDGVLTLTRSEMRLINAFGREHSYPRVLNLWEIWRDRGKSRHAQKAVVRLAPRRAEHEKRILARMKERGIDVAPGSAARQRPPVIRPAEPPNAAPQPLLAVTEFGYHNSTGTVLAVYADGRLICRYPTDSDEPAYHISTVADPQLLCAELLGPDFGRLPAKFVVSEGTDQATTTIWTPGKTVEVYGPWRAPNLIPDDTPAPGSAIESTNRRIRQTWEAGGAGNRPALLRIDKQREARGDPWLPQSIEVTFTEYENARDPAIEWPQKWPGLYDASSQKHDSRCYSVFVPGSDHAELVAFLATRRPRGAVMIDLNQMAPEVRFPFPAENAWLHSW